MLYVIYNKSLHGSIPDKLKNGERVLATSSILSAVEATYSLGSLHSNFRHLAASFDILHHAKTRGGFIPSIR